MHRLITDPDGARLKVALQMLQLPLLADSVRVQRIKRGGELGLPRFSKPKSMERMNVIRVLLPVSFGP